MFGIVWLKDWVQTADNRQIIGYAGRVEFTPDGFFIFGNGRRVFVPNEQVRSVETFEAGLPAIRNLAVEQLEPEA